MLKAPYAVPVSRRVEEIVWLLIPDGNCICVPSARPSISRVDVIPGRTGMGALPCTLFTMTFAAVEQLVERLDVTVCPFTELLSIVWWLRVIDCTLNSHFAGAGNIAPQVAGKGICPGDKSPLLLLARKQVDRSYPVVLDQYDEKVPDLPNVFVH